MSFRIRSRRNCAEAPDERLDPIDRHGIGVVIRDNQPRTVIEQVGACVLEPAVRRAGGDATFVRANVAEWDDCRTMVATAMDTYGALHVLYNNAGIFPADDGGVLDTPQDTWRRVMAVNLEGVWLGCKAGIPAMLESGGGAIVNVSSLAGRSKSAMGGYAYSSSKAGLLGLTRHLAFDYGPKGVRVNAICPGGVDTPMLRAAGVREARSEAEQAARATRMAAYQFFMPIKRVSQPEEQAAAIASVSSIGYSGFLVGPPLIGFIAQSVSLTAAMSVMLSIGLVGVSMNRYFVFGLIAGPTSSGFEVST